MASTLQIPDRWIGGFLRAHKGATVADAVAYWLEQERLEQQWKAQHGR